MNTPQIFIIDDDETIVDLLQFKLEQVGYEIDCANSGPAAIEKLKTIHPDVILLDIDMPNSWDGFKTCHELKKISHIKQIPVLFLSGRNELECKIKAFSSGANDILNKPFQDEELLARIKTQVELYRYQQQLNQLVEQRTEQLKIAKNEAEQANNAKSTFLMMMSHELRTPLNHIIGYSDILEMDVEDENLADMIANINNVKHASNVLLCMVKNMLELVQIDSGKVDIHRQELNIKTYLSEKFHEFKKKASLNNNQITLHYANIQEKFLTDPEKFKTIFENILDNACKFTENGRITVHVDDIQHDDQTWLQIAIKDTGPGIDKDKQQHIFKAFTQSDESATRKHSGIGIGLALAQGFCQAFGGEIKLKSQLGEGSNFTIQLPVK